ncbi:hypothetical protein D3C81_1160490 [compost metagenome]
MEIKILGVEADRSGAQFTSTYDFVFKITGPKSRNEIIEMKKGWVSPTLKNNVIEIIMKWVNENKFTIEFAKPYLECIEIDDEMLTPGLDLDDFYEMDDLQKIQNLPYFDEYIRQLIEDYEDCVLLIDESGNEITN